MTKYLLTRLRQSLITLFLVSMVVFAGIRALPGDPALALAGEERSPEALAAIRESYGLNDNIVVQYARFIGHALTGDLGTSSRTGLPVSDAIAQALPVTLELAALSLLLAVVVGIGAGVVAAVRRGRPEEVTPPALGLRRAEACCQRSSFCERQESSPLLSGTGAGVGASCRAGRAPLLPFAGAPRRGSPASVIVWPAAGAAPGRSKPTRSRSPASSACADSACGAYWSG